MINSVIIVTVAAVAAVAGILLLVRQMRQRMERFKEAEKAIAIFLDFNKQVSYQLQVLEEQGRLCYRSLDGEAMRLLYQAQKMVRHGFELERLGINALATGNPELLSEVGELFDLDLEEETVQTYRHPLEELSPREYKIYASMLLKRIDDKINVGLQNRRKLYSVAA